MSIQAIAAVLDLEDPRLDATAKMVLIGIANHTSTNGQCFPSVRLLMRYSGMGESTVRAVIKKLETWGLIRVERRDGHASLYYLTLTPADIEGVTPPDPAPTPLVSGPTPPDPGPSTPPTSGPITVTIEPSLSASDAREGLPADWQPSPGLLVPIAEEFKHVDIEHQVALFVAYNRAHGHVLVNPDAAFKAWMLRTKELRSPPKPRAATAAGPVPVGPAASAAALERDAETDRFRSPDNAAEALLKAAMLWVRAGDEAQAADCTTRASRLMRKGSWHEDQLLAFVATQPWGEQWIKENNTS